MSVSGQIRPPRDVRGMSVISPKAAVMRTSSFGRFVPIAAICAAAIPSLFDNLVGDSIKNSDRRMLRHSTEQQRGARTYPPLNTLKLVAEDVWIVDGPVVRFGMMPWPKMAFPTRMTIIRVASGNLFIHSPTPLISSLKRELDGIGTPRWIIGPNRIHYWWIPGTRVFP
jgi:hypothetical protein